MLNRIKLHLKQARKSESKRKRERERKRNIYLFIKNSLSKLRAQSPAFQAVSSVSADSVNAPEFVPRFTTGMYTDNNWVQ